MTWVVVGAGAWGSAFARLVHERGHDVTLACRDAAFAAEIAATGRNERYLPSADLEGIAAAALAEAPIAGADVVVVAVPSHAFGATVAALPGTAPVLSLTKGLDPATGARLSTLVHGRSVAVLSGPNFAEEIADGLPAAATIASDDPAFAEAVQHAIGSLTFERPDFSRFPALRVAMDCLKAGGSLPTVLNAANEIAVEAFLEGRISFHQIASLVEAICEDAVRRGDDGYPATVSDALAIDSVTRQRTREALLM